MRSWREDAAAGDSTSPDYGASHDLGERGPGWISADGHVLLLEISHLVLVGHFRQGQSLI